MKKYCNVVLGHRTKYHQPANRTTFYEVKMNASAPTFRKTHENKLKHARARERSRLLAEVIGREQRVIDDGHPALLVDLARIVSSNAEKEADATAAARRSWWAEARESLLSLFVSAHSSRQRREGSLPSSSPLDDGNGGRAAAPGVDVVDDYAPVETHLPAASSLVLIRTRLDELLRAEETRGTSVRGGDTLAAADIGEAGLGEEAAAGKQGPLHLAVAEKQRCGSEVVGRCLDAIEAARSSDSSARGERRNQRSKEANAAAEDGAIASSGDGGDGSDGVSRSVTHDAEAELSLFQFRLEAGAVQLAAASLEADVRLLAIGPAAPATAAEVASFRTPTGTRVEENPLSLLPEDDPPPGELTRSQLDLRRAARVKAFARALGEMLCRGRETLQQKAAQVPPEP